MKNSKLIFILFSVTIFCSFLLLAHIQKMSMNMVAKSLHKGKSVVAKAEVYYQTTGGLMVTHFTSPIEQVVITNSKGEYKNYDVQNNTLVQSMGLDYSSKNSFFYFFLSGKTQDMGLTAFGYSLKDTRVEKEMVITTYLPPANSEIKLSKVEIVHENYAPIFMGFFDLKGKPVQKVFYSNYQETQGLRLPMSITEFEYLPDGDSVISKRTYSDIKINEQVNSAYLNYKIPVNAKLVKGQE